MVILDLMRAIQPLAVGRTARLPIESAEDQAVVAAWCATTGNTLVGAGPGFVEVRRGRPAPAEDQLPPGLRPGGRLWMYTNFDCNLACDYCCVRSSPTTDRRALGLDVVRRLVAEAVPAGVTELYLTGGEPFVLPDIGELVEVCARALPTTLLTNGMLFRGRRLESLRSMHARTSPFRSAWTRRNPVLMIFIADEDDCSLQHVGLFDGDDWLARWSESFDRQSDKAVKLVCPPDPNLCTDGSESAAENVSTTASSQE